VPLDEWHLERYDGTQLPTLKEFGEITRDVDEANTCGVRGSMVMVKNETRE
jgi:hypothetical protein